MTETPAEVSFLPKRLDLEVYQGDLCAFSVRLRELVYDSDTETWVAGDWINLSGATVVAKVKKTKTSTTPAAEFTCTPDPDQVTNKGRVALRMEPNVTSAIRAGRYVWDLQVVQSPTDIKTRLAGKFVVTGEVTT